MDWKFVEDHILPEMFRPTPLPPDFDKLIISTNPPAGTTPDKLFSLLQQRQTEIQIQQTAEEILKKNETIIKQAAAKIASSSATTATGEIFHNLIPTSFNEEEFLNEAERQLEKKRQAARKDTRSATP